MGEVTNGLFIFMFGIFFLLRTYGVRVNRVSALIMILVGLVLMAGMALNIPAVTVK